MMKRRSALQWRPSEIEIAEVLVKHFHDSGFIVFQEVEYSRDWKRPTADLVIEGKGMKGKSGLEIIEVKRSMTMSVLAQAIRWRHIVSRISIAIPDIRIKYPDVIDPVLDRYGIGLYRVRMNSGLSRDPEVKVDRAPESRAAQWEANFRSGICDLHRDFAKAGNPDGKRVTAWTVTVQNLIDYVFENGRTPIRSALKMISHHYSSNTVARASITRQIRRGDIPDLQVDKKSGQVFVELSGKALGQCDSSDLDVPEVFR